jgi:predicted helicase
MLYRPFDFRKTVYTGHSKGFLAYPREKISRNFVNKENVGLITNRQHVNGDFSHIGVTKNIICHGTFYLGNKGQDYLFPLYLYAEDGTRVSNLNKDIVKKVKEIIGTEPSPEDIFDYVYAVLHSPTYRGKYKEPLQMDFPRVPFPKNQAQFDTLVALGKELRELHLLESPKVRQFTTSYPEDGANKVEKVKYKDAKVYINEMQYFGGVPEDAWTFYVGGYQPAQKWLKDRVGRTLTNADIERYQKMIVALTETKRVMQEIDKSGFEVLQKH